MPVADTDPQLVEALTEALKSFWHAVTQARLYGSEHPETMRSVEAFREGIDRIMAYVGPVMLATSIDGLAWRGAPVSIESEERKGLGRHLHVEGIASLGFSSGVTTEELKKLLLVLRVNLSLPQYEEETLESLLWQADFEHIQFAAVSALAEAEALSGQTREALGDVEDAIRQILELRVAPEGRERNLRQMVSEDQLHRAVFEAEVALERDGAKAQYPEDTDGWQVRFNRESEQDFEVIEQMRRGLEQERPSDMTQRLVGILLRVGLARRPEFPLPEVLEFTKQAVDVLYEANDAAPIVAVLEEAQRLVRLVDTRDQEGFAFVRQVYDFALPPFRVAKVLVSLDPASDADRSVLLRFFQLMPTHALLALIEFMGRETEPAKQRALFRVMGESAGPRLAKAFVEAERMPPEQCVPLILFFRAMQTQGERTIRPKLMARSAPAIRIATLQWYADDLPPGEVGLVIGCLLDKHGAIRKAAVDALTAQKPKGAVPTLEEAIRSTRFTELDGPRKADICVAYGGVAGERAIDLLAEIFQTKVPMFGEKGDAKATVMAGAMGLVATRSERAMGLVKREAGAWMSPRASTANRALGSQTAPAGGQRGK